MGQLANAYLNEYWAIIPGHPDYEVSTHGRIKRITSNKRTSMGYVLAGHPTVRGYKIVNLNGKGYLVSHLVMAVFTGPVPQGNEVHHIDGDVSNDWLYNLEYVDSKNHRSKYHSKLPDTAVKEIRKRYTEGEGMVKLAKAFNVSYSYVNYIIHKKSRKEPAA